jgi:hypothetical protein
MPAHRGTVGRVGRQPAGPLRAAVQYLTTTSSGGEVQLKGER